MLFNHQGEEKAKKLLYIKYATVAAVNVQMVWCENPGKMYIV
jgi:hypothetical protein